MQQFFQALLLLSRPRLVESLGLRLIVINSASHQILTVRSLLNLAIILGISLQGKKFNNNYT